MRSGDLGGEETKDLFGNRTRPFNPSSNKAIQPTDLETAINPRARSARLRIADTHVNKLRDKQEEPK
jgi:16S rRNA (cytosine1402-N4)-methyltransferase